MTDWASADLILDQSGAVPFPSPASTVQYAVYANPSSDVWTSDLLSGSGLTAWNMDGGGPVALGGAATTAAYIYLYEVFNSSSTIIEHLMLISSSMTGVSSFGFISTSSTLGALDPNGGVFTSSSNYSVKTGSGQTVTSVDMNVPPDVPVAALAFNFQGSGHNIPHPGNSVILFLTSSDGPGLGVGQIQDTVLNSVMPIVVPTPLPAALALLLSGLPVGLGFGLIKGRGRSRVNNKA